MSDAKINQEMLVGVVRNALAAVWGEHSGITVVNYGASSALVTDGTDVFIVQVSAAEVCLR